MKKMLWAVMFVAAVAWFATPVDASGLFRRASRDCGDCAAPCAPCAMPVTWTEQQVQGFRLEMRTREVPTKVTRMVPKVVEEVVKYNVCEVVSTPEKRQVTTYKQVMKEVPYVYTVSVPVVTPTKQQVTTYKQVMKEVPYVYTVNVPVITPTKQQVTTYQCVPETITTVVNVARRVPTCVIDPCTGCVRSICTTVCEAVPQTRTVMKPVPVTQEVVVNVCTYRAEERKGVRTVCEVVPVTQEVVVNVCTYRAEERKAVRSVCEVVPVMQEVVVNVCRTVMTERSAKVQRTICVPVVETVNVRECYYERVPYTYTIRVPVPCAPTQPIAQPCASCETPCGTAVACNSCGGGRGRHVRCCR